MKHRRKIKGEEQVITLQIAQQLKNKNINVVTRQLFRRQCKAKFLLETVFMIKKNFNLLQTLTMNSLNVKHQGISVNWYFTCHLTRIYEKERYFRCIKSTSCLFERFRV